MSPVAHPDEEGRAVVESGIQGGAESEREAAFHVDIPVEIGLQKAHVAEQQHPPRRASVPDDDRRVRRSLVVLPGRAVGEHDAKADLGLRADLGHFFLETRVHDLSEMPCARRDLDSFLLQLEAAEDQAGKGAYPWRRWFC